MGGGPVKPATPAAPATASTPAPAPAPVGEQVLKVPVGRINPCPFQPRKDFAPEKIEELANSIKEQGILQPLIVRKKGDGYELIAGERRWRAAQLAQLTELPVIVRQASDEQVLEFALIENLQRADLNPLEEALGYSQLMQQFSLTQEDVAQKVGRNRATVANSLRLLQLSPEVQAFLRSNLLTVGHAKALAGLTAHDKQKTAAEEIIREQLSVRATEDLVAALQAQAPASRNGLATKPPIIAPDVHVSALQSRLQEKFGTKVFVKYRKGKGAVEIRFFSDDDLNRVLDLIGVSLD